MPPPDPLVLAHQFATLAALDSTLILTSRALLMTYPDARCPPRAAEPPDVTTARTLVEHCTRLLAALDCHRFEIVAQLPTSADVDNADWPF